MTLEEALQEKEIPDEIRNIVTLVTVPYFSFGGTEEEGQLVVHKDLAPDIEALFAKLFEMQFPIQRMIPIVAYDWDDALSMAANNSSAFNYRVIAGTDRRSNHAYGRAVDINPVQNPYVGASGVVAPEGAVYDLAQKGTVTALIAEIFQSYGWKWGGDWTDRKDWQHFEKPM